MQRDGRELHARPPFGNSHAVAREIAAGPCHERQEVAAKEFCLMARALWELKAPAALHDHTKSSERTCRAWASGHSEPPFRVGVALLLSDDGGRALEWIMRDHNPAWWQKIQRAIRIAEQIDKLNLE